MDPSPFFSLFLSHVLLPEEDFYTIEHSGWITLPQFETEPDDELSFPAQSSLEGKLLEARDHTPSFSTTFCTQRVFKECYGKR